MSTYRLRLKPLTPVHIGRGSGEVLEPYAYTVKQKRAYILSLSRLFEALLPIPRERYLKALEEGPLAARDELQTIVGTGLDLEMISTWQADVKEGFLRYFTSRLDSRRAALEVRIFPRALKGPYLSGSSLKGAVRTALLADQLNQKLSVEDEQRDLQYDERQRRWLEHRPGQGRIHKPDMRQRGYPWMRVNQLLEASIFDYEARTRRGDYRGNISADPMRTIAITDSTPLPGTSFAQLEVWGSRPKRNDPRKGPEKPTGITLLAEVWERGEVEATLRINEGFQEKSIYGLTFKPQLQDILYSTYMRYLNLAEQEKDEYAQRNWEDAYNVMQDVLDEIEACLDEDNEFSPPYRFPLRFGFGTGDLTSRLAEFIEHNPISRTLVEEIPLGWVLAEVID